MAVAKVKCPDCGLALNPAKAPQPGKKVKCPRCANIFVVPAPTEVQAPPQPAAKKASPAIQKAPSKPAAAGKAPAPPGKPPGPPPAADDEAGIYGLKMSAEEEKQNEEEKPDIVYAPDLSVKDPRGPATAVLVKPTNIMLLLGSLGFFWGVFVFGAGLWPFIFSEYLVPPEMMGPTLKALDQLRGSIATEKDPDKKKKLEVQRDNSFKITLTQLYKNEKYLDALTVEDLQKRSPELYAVWESLNDERSSDLVLQIVIGVIEMILGGALAYSAVRLQNIDSLVWAWAAVGLCMVNNAALGGFYLAQLLGKDEADESLLDYPLELLCAARIGGGLFLGGIVISLLKQEKIKAAFDYNPE
jgi:hypothetical protein